MGKKIVIVGAGPAGLGAAYRLAELGHEDWEVFEREDHVGGLASSYTDEHGFIWDTSCSAITATSMISSRRC